MAKIQAPEHGQLMAPSGRARDDLKWLLSELERTNAPDTRVAESDPIRKSALINSLADSNTISGSALPAARQAFRSARFAVKKAAFVSSGHMKVLPSISDDMEAVGGHRNGAPPPACQR
jgi:hypothetical protein